MISIDFDANIKELLSKNNDFHSFQEKSKISKRDTIVFYNDISAPAPTFLMEKYRNHLFY